MFKQFFKLIENVRELIRPSRTINFQFFHSFL